MLRMIGIRKNKERGGICLYLLEFLEKGTEGTCLSPERTGGREIERKAS